MTKIVDTYGLDCDDLEQARATVEGALSVPFGLRDSLYWGGAYYLARAPEYGKMAIRPNLNTFTGKLGEPESPGSRFIVAVSEPPDPDLVRERLVGAGLQFLRRDEVSPPERPRKP
jgi:hypothetical protein